MKESDENLILVTQNPKTLKKYCVDSRNLLEATTGLCKYSLSDKKIDQIYRKWNQFEILSILLKQQSKMYSVSPNDSLHSNLTVELNVLT